MVLVGTFLGDAVHARSDDNRHRDVGASFSILAARFVPVAAALAQHGDSKARSAESTETAGMAFRAVRRDFVPRPPLPPPPRRRIYPPHGALPQDARLRQRLRRVRRTRRLARPDARRAAAIADRRTGVGCDQFIAIEPAPENSDADAFMRIRNPDGSEAGACGNATRCVVDLLAARPGGTCR